MSRYYVVQYHPDMVRGECVNIGVIVFDDAGHGKASFLHEWERVAAFAQRNVDFLKEFSSRIMADSDSGAIDETYMGRMGQWINSIQVTAPRATSMGLAWVEERFLVNA